MSVSERVARLATSMAELFDLDDPELFTFDGSVAWHEKYDKERVVGLKHAHLRQAFGLAAEGEARCSCACGAHACAFA
jgi:hypothetical protein